MAYDARAVRFKGWAQKARREHHAWMSEKCTAPPRYQSHCACGWSTVWPGVYSYAYANEALRQHRLNVNGSSEP